MVMVMPVDVHRVSVPPISEMDTDTFCKHMNKRHSASLAGTTLDPRYLNPYVEGLYRSYHRWLHHPLFPVSVTLDHDHDLGSHNGQ